MIEAFEEPPEKSIVLAIGRRHFSTELLTFDSCVVEEARVIDFNVRATHNCTYASSERKVLFKCAV